MPANGVSKTKRRTSSGGRFIARFPGCVPPAGLAVEPLPDRALRPQGSPEAQPSPAAGQEKRKSRGRSSRASTRAVPLARQPDAAGKGARDLHAPQGNGKVWGQDGDHPFEPGDIPVEGSGQLFQGGAAQPSPRREQPPDVEPAHLEARILSPPASRSPPRPGGSVPDSPSPAALAQSSLRQGRVSFSARKLFGVTCSPAWPETSPVSRGSIKRADANSRSTSIAGPGVTDPRAEKFPLGEGAFPAGGRSASRRR